MVRGPAMSALRDGTQDLHERVDRSIREGDWFTSRAAYVELLRRTLGFHRIVEATVASHIPSLCDGGWQWRPRSPLIEADLRALTEADDSHRASARPDESLLVEGRAGAVGVLYVVEGSALGGRVLARWIRARLGYDGTRGASSFLPYGDAPGERWREFAEIAERTALARPTAPGKMVAAARAAFELHEGLIGVTAGSMRSVGAAVGA